MSRIRDAFLVLIGHAEIVLNKEIAFVEQFVRSEEARVETMISDALNALSAAKDAALKKIADEANALAGAQSDLSAANAQVASLQAQLADAENQINAVAAQLNPQAA
jgi:predicted  nucleic acid-binding Zn-ribbon protein